MFFAEFVKPYESFISIVASADNAFHPSWVRRSRMRTQDDNDLQVMSVGVIKLL
jgi:hypothetical protein